LALQIKELEVQSLPLKKCLVDYAKKVNLPKLAIGEVLVERREAVKAELDARKVTPDWLYRLQSGGFYDLIEIKVGRSAAESADAKPLMDEVGLKAELAQSFAVKV
jgi:hypothetical protein